MQLPPFPPNNRWIHKSELPEKYTVGQPCTFLLVIAHGKPKAKEVMWPETPDGGADDEAAAAVGGVSIGGQQSCSSSAAIGIASSPIRSGASAARMTAGDSPVDKGGKSPIKGGNASGHAKGDAKDAKDAKDGAKDAKAANTSLPIGGGASAQTAVDAVPSPMSAPKTSPTYAEKLNAGKAKAAPKANGKKP